MKDDLMEAITMDSKQKKEDIKEKEIEQQDGNLNSEIKEEQNSKKEQTEKQDTKKAEQKDNIEETSNQKNNKKDKDNKINKEDKDEKINKKHKNNDTKNKEKQKSKSKKDLKKNKEKRKLKKIIISIIIIAIIGLIFSTVFALTNINNEKIISGISIQGIDVSGLTKEEAKAKLETAYSEKQGKNIELKYQDLESELNPTIIEVKYDIESAVENAYSKGRDSNIFMNNYNILFALIGKKDININMSLNEEIAKQTINDIGTNLPGIMTQSSYSIENDKLIITRGKEGILIKTDELLSKVKEELSQFNITENYIEIPVETKKPEDIDIDKIHSEVYKEVKDAYYTKNPFTVYPEVEGVDFDVEKAKQMIAAEQKDEYIIDLVITKPQVTIDKIGTEAFPDQLATFTTRYDASDKDRTTNLNLACQKINGKIILPGATFSYNETLGQRSYSSGYRNAKVYENGQVVDGIGGGICQISSTLYNSVLMSDLEIVERRNHQFVTSYTGAGRDATVVYGVTDFKFKNTRKYPIRVVASSKSGVATVSIYGIKEADREYTYSFSTKTISTIPFTTKYVEDANLTAGKEVVKQKGANGLVTETYMTKRLNGKIVSTKLLSKDTYSAMQKIINRGKSSATTNVEVNTEVNQTQQPNTTPQEQQPQTPQQEHVPKEEDTQPVEGQ